MTKKILRFDLINMKHEFIFRGNKNVTFEDKYESSP